MNLNKVHLIGRVTKDPELKKLPSGSAVCSFSLATNRTYKDKNGQKVENTDFHNLVAFGKTAEVIAQYVVKGQLLYTDGRLQTRTWADKTSGKNLYRTEIILENFQFGPKAGQGQPERQKSGNTSKTAYKSKEEQDKDEEYDNYNEPAGGKSDYADSEDINPEDIPF